MGSFGASIGASWPSRSLRGAQKSQRGGGGAATACEGGELHSCTRSECDSRAIGLGATEPWKEHSHASGREPARRRQPAVGSAEADDTKRAHLGADLGRRRAIEPDTREHPADCCGRVAPFSHHPPRDDKEDRSAGEAPIATRQDDVLPGLVASRERAIDLPLSHPVAVQSERSKGRATRGIAARTSSRTRRFDRRQSREPALDFDATLNNPLRAPLFFQAVRSTTRGSRCPNAVPLVALFCGRRSADAPPPQTLLC